MRYWYVLMPDSASLPLTVSLTGYWVQLPLSYLLPLAVAVMLGAENIGMVDAYFEAPGETELGWIIDKRYWGNGYAAEAARGLITVCREYLEMRRFVAHCDSENRASIRVMEKLGMQLEEQQGGRYNRSGGGVRLESRYAVVFSDNQ